MEASKKTISLNINGIIFHVEEAGFELLKNYLSAITKNFSGYANSAELMADIEGRIAEFLLERIEYPKEYISLLDVEDLIAMMGTVPNFDPADYKQQASNTYKEYAYAQSPAEEALPKKLYRDTRRKVLGGVASGIAHYFSIDPLWIRLLFLLVFFDIPSFLAVSGTATLIYCLLWAITPGNNDLEENESVRQLFRDADGRMIAGVAGGLAAYLKVDPTLVRIGFVLSTALGGIGLLSYIILWVITPAANSVTERMRMSGEAITLENIENRIREQLKFDSSEKEEIWVQRLMTPFRLGARFVEYAEQRFEGTDVPRTAFTLGTLMAGGFLTLIATAASAGLFFSFAFLSGLYPAASFFKIDEVPLQLIQSTIPTATLGFVTLAVWVPFAFLGIAGISLAARRVVTPRIVHWGLLGLMAVGIIGSAFTVPMMVSDFQSEGINKQEFSFPMSPSTPIVLQAAEAEGGIENVCLTIKGHEKSEIFFEQKFIARGASRQDAIEHAGNIEYIFSSENGVFTFPESYTLEEGSPFRAQEVAITMYMPYGQEFIMPKSLRGILRNTITPHGYRVRDLSDSNRWVYNESGLRCITCEGKAEEEEGYASSTHVESFSSINVGENCQVLIKQGKEQHISVEGVKEGEGPFGFQVEDGVLHINQEASARGTKIVIEVVSLERLDLEGSADVVLEGIEQEHLEINISDGASCTVEAFVNNLVIIAQDGAKIILKGKGESLSIEAEDGARVDAREYKANDLKAVGTDGARLKLGKASNCQVESDDNCHVEREED